MIHGILLVIIAVSAGFGLGRVKNAKKLAAVSTEITKIETGITTDVKAGIAAIKSHL